METKINNIATMKVHASSGPRRVVKDGWFLFDTTLGLIAFVEQFVGLFSNGGDSGYAQQAQGPLKNLKHSSTTEKNHTVWPE